MKMQKVGGYSAIASVCLIVVLVAIVLPIASRYGLNQPNAGLDPAKVAAVYAGAPTEVWAASVLEIVISILFLFVAFALYERMEAKTPTLVRMLVIAASASCILTIIDAMIGIRSMASMTGAGDVSIYKPVLVLGQGLSTASDHIGGWSILLIGAAALAARALPRLVGWVFLVLGILGVVGFALPDIGAGMAGLIVIGLLYAISMIWTGIVLLRAAQETAAPVKTMSAQAR
jgi:hypothetical protein